jgi:hypothetical protein
MPKRTSLSDVACSSRSVSDFSWRLISFNGCACHGFRAAKWPGPTQSGPVRPARPRRPTLPLPRSARRPAPPLPRGGAAAPAPPLPPWRPGPGAVSGPRRGVRPPARPPRPRRGVPAPRRGPLPPARSPPARGLGPLRTAFGSCARRPGPGATRVASFTPLTRSHMRKPTRAVIIFWVCS